MDPVIGVSMKPGEIIVGDDLGVRQLLTQTMRFHWRAVPFLRMLNCSPMVYLRTCYYPKEGKPLLDIKEHIRLSTGIGLGFEIMPELTFLFYYNVANLLEQNGDHTRHTFGITLTIF